MEVNYAQGSFTTLLIYNSEFRSNLVSRGRNSAEINQCYDLHCYIDFFSMF